MENYYTAMKHLRDVQREIADIDEMNHAIENGTRTDWVAVSSHYTIKYEAIINRIGDTLTGLRVIHDTGLYDEKDDDQILTELVYIRACVIIYAAVRCRMEPDIKTGALKVFT